MNGRSPIGYVVQIDGINITLNLLDMHRGHLAAHVHGVSNVTEIGNLLVIEAGSRALIMKVMSLSFAEPREAHRSGIGSPTHQSEPLRNLSGVVVGRLVRKGQQLEFISDSLSTPPLGAEVFPLIDEESSAVLGRTRATKARINLGEDLRGGGSLFVGLQDLLSRHVAVLGSSGQGKTCFTSAILQQISRFPNSRVVVFDINGEYEDALRTNELAKELVHVTRLGGDTDESYRLPYYALGRQGLQRLLLPSDKTQRPALGFALEHLNKVQWFPDSEGLGLADDDSPSLFADCRLDGAPKAAERIRALRDNNARCVEEWPPMQALSALIAESHALVPKKGTIERDSFYYSNVAPLITRVNRFVDDPMFCEVVDVHGGVGLDPQMTWSRESTALVERIFGGSKVDWRVHIVDLRLVSHDLTPFVLGALLELFAYELFRRGQAEKIATLLVLEEAHHYLRSMGTSEEAISHALAYERLAKEGRKFGLALWLSTQRPSEISSTVLAQCNNWISFRLTSDKDLAVVQSASEWVDRREVGRIAGLPRQNALAFGGSLEMPTLIRAPVAYPLPRSEEAAFDQWADRHQEGVRENEEGEH